MVSHLDQVFLLNTDLFGLLLVFLSHWKRRFVTENDEDRNHVLTRGNIFSESRSDWIKKLFFLSQRMCRFVKKQLPVRFQFVSVRFICFGPFGSTKLLEFQFSR